MKKISTVLAILGLVLTFGAGSALAKKTGGTTFENCDKNNDSFLTQQEYLSCFPRSSAAKFAAMDADKDGKLTKEEIKAYRDAKNAPAKKTKKAAKEAQ